MTAYDPTLSETYRAIGVTFEDLWTRDRAMRDVLARARRAAGSDVTLLLLGENGTGKNLLAQAIHNASPRAEGPFVPVNCSAIPPGLLESELFGHERGAFTGAEKARRGKFELADRGTLLLDEVADLSREAQAKILRAVEYREFERVGGEETLRTDVRIVAATNTDIRARVERGEFRADLFYRLHEVTIEVPPLRHRRGDVALLAGRFLAEAARKAGRKAPALAPAALRARERHDWPGNVRELRSVLRRAVTACAGDRVEVADLGLPGSRLEPALVEPGDWSLAAAERRQIENVLELTRGRKKEACRLLGISRPTLDRKIEEHRIEWREDGAGES